MKIINFYEWAGRIYRVTTESVDVFMPGITRPHKWTRSNVFKDELALIEAGAELSCNPE